MRFAGEFLFSMSRCNKRSAAKKEKQRPWAGFDVPFQKRRREGTILLSQRHELHKSSRDRSKTHNFLFICVSLRIRCRSACGDVY